MTAQRLPLHAICPYFAMFPEDFVREQVESLSQKGDWIFDPFCGRGTTILESLLLERNAAGSDINPVAFCISKAKAERPSLEETHARLNYLEERFKKRRSDKWQDERSALPAFFKRAFFKSTLEELLFLRSTLDWRYNRIDRFIAALILGSLHGEMNKSDAYFSNQMPRTICLKPGYSLRYWKDKGLFPKKRAVFNMLRKKAEYRLRDIPESFEGRVKMADARKASACFHNLRGMIALVVTSPPYLNVTCYEEDQWLRLWFLGGEPWPTYGKVSKDDRHNAEKKYWGFLNESWAGIAPLMKNSAHLVIRLGAIGITEEEMTRQLKLTIKGIFPNSYLVGQPEKSRIVRRQTQSFLPSSKGCRFEMDYIFKL